MKAVQLTFDEKLLVELDAGEDVRLSGRSAVVQRLINDYLQRKAESAIDESCRRGYSDGTGLGPAFEGWEKEGRPLTRYSRRKTTASGGGSFLDDTH